MARRTFRVSRHGLTACPGCGTHIRIDSADWRQTVCPFCDAELLAKAPPGLRAPGRAGLLAAGLLSLGIAACDDGGGSGDVGVDPADVAVDGGLGDMGPDDLGPDDDMDPAEPDLGEEDAEVDMELAPDFGLQPEYGKPADDFGVEQDMELAPDFGGQPEYGGPPPDFGPPMDAEVDEAVALPPYGIPPQEDLGPPSTRDAEVDAEEPVPVPLYGVPPQPEEA